MLITSPPPSGVELRPARVMFVDDERLVLRSLQRLMRMHHPAWEVRCAQCPLDALEVLTDFSPDVLVTDLSMPKMNGLELLRIVRDRYPSIRRLVYSAHVETLGRVHFGDLVVDALLKPAHSESIVSAIRRAASTGDHVLNVGGASA